MLPALLAGKQIEGDNGENAANEKSLSVRREWKKRLFRDCLITSLSKCSVNSARNETGVNNGV